MNSLLSLFSVLYRENAGFQPTFHMIKINIKIFASYIYIYIFLFAKFNLIAHFNVKKTFPSYQAARKLPWSFLVKIVEMREDGNVAIEKTCFLVYFFVGVGALCK